MPPRKRACVTRDRVATRSQPPPEPELVLVLTDDEDEDEGAPKFEARASPLSGLISRFSSEAEGSPDSVVDLSSPSPSPSPRWLGALQDSPMREAAEVDRYDDGDEDDDDDEELGVCTGVVLPAPGAPAVSSGTGVDLQLDGSVLDAEGRLLGALASGYASCVKPLLETPGLRREATLAGDRLEMRFRGDFDHMGAVLAAARACELFQFVPEDEPDPFAALALPTGPVPALAPLPPPAPEDPLEAAGASAADDILGGRHAAYISPGATQELRRVLERSDAMSELYRDVGEATTPEELKTQLYSHQGRALAWMRQREQNITVEDAMRSTGMSKIFFWERTPYGYFRNLLTHIDQINTPVLPRGGILADDMGLGKTLTTVALIVGDLPFPDRQTLVVCPMSVLAVWEVELISHLADEDSLSVVTYHGGERRQVDVRQANVVITTYDVLNSDFKRKNDSSRLHRREWYRVVLDEAHCVKNASTGRFTAVQKLKAQVRWCITATPIQNHLNDIHSLLRFLRIKPFDDLKVWKKLIFSPLEREQAGATERLQTLLSTFTMRRRKDMLDADGNPIIRLPAKAVIEFKIKLAPSERRHYDNLYKSCLQVIQNAMDADAAKKGRPRDGESADDRILNNYHHILVIILRLRQLCLHSGLVPPEVIGGLVHNLRQALAGKVSDNTLEPLRKLAEANELEECVICMEPDSPQDPVVTGCGHYFCRECIVEWLQNMAAQGGAEKNTCPMCRREVTEDKLVNLIPTEEERAQRQADQSAGVDEEMLNVANFSVPSSKIHAVMAKLQQFRAEDRERDDGRVTKTVIFSQFTAYLQVFRTHLEGAGFACAELCGQMNAQKRREAIVRLQTDPSCVIMLASLKAAGVGITLTAATKAILLDPWWNPAVEEQAIDRIHRLGQQHDVEVFRMIAKHSIEEKMLQLHEYKTEIARTALATAKSGGALLSREERQARSRELRLARVHKLFDLNDLVRQEEEQDKDEVEGNEEIVRSSTSSSSASSSSTRSSRPERMAQRWTFVLGHERDMVDAHGDNAARERAMWRLTNAQAFPHQKFLMLPSGLVRLVVSFV